MGSIAEILYLAEEVQLTLAVLDYELDL